MLKFNLLSLPEEEMNFKLSNIPGNSVYINCTNFCELLLTSSGLTKSFDD